MRKTNNSHIFLVRNALCVTYGWRIGAREGGNLASEPSEPANGLLITGKLGRGTKKRYKLFISKSINSTCIFSTDAICYAHILAA